MSSATARSPAQELFDDTGPRTLVLCFDGTTNEFNDHNTNVVKLYKVFERDSPRQLCYYQPGIGTGTFTPNGYLSPVMRRLESWLDQAFAIFIDYHIRSGYTFIMQNFLPGDKICLFGFSRGAYTARALAGMLYKVGLLPKDNVEQVGFAYKLYKQTGKDNDKLANGYKETFCREVSIDFMGVWDTVESVGIFSGRNLPFATSNEAIHVFRHALALDECRVKFRPNLWGSQWREDVKINEMKPAESESLMNKQENEKKTDVLEMWFVGCHSDVGGGSVKNIVPNDPSRISHDLSRISLRWMVREIFIASKNCGIIFDPQELKKSSIPLYDSSIPPLADSPSQAEDEPDSGDIWQRGLLAARKQAQMKDMISQHDVIHGIVTGNNKSLTTQDKEDAVAPLHSSLEIQHAWLAAVFWWFLELFWIGYRHVHFGNKSCRSFRPNMGRGRVIPMETPKFHWTVETRMGHKNSNYKPKARCKDDKYEPAGKPT